MKQFTLSYSHRQGDKHYYEFVPVSIGQAKAGTIVVDRIPTEVGLVTLPYYNSDQKVCYIHEGNNKFRDLTESEWREHERNAAS